ncbi:CPBP family glutamic-type intramembrane protease [Nonomuraea angiospora]|uniref:CPBP family glutamic-type intramembrane protease n=1 Tax=Nonomuraea angiospora TaxID=46172 RepID=UPI00331CBDB7
MVSTDTLSSARRGRLVRSIRNRPLLSFFLLAFAPAWAYELVGILVLRLPLVPWMFAAPFLGPFLAAVVVTAATDGRAGVQALLGDLLRFHAGLRWYLLVMIGVPALLMVCVLPLPGAVAAFRPTPGALGGYAAGFIAVMLVGGPLGEEPGWRCFATPRLQARYGPALGTFLLGLLWGLWHLPLFLIEGYNHAGAHLTGLIVPYLVFLVFTIVVSYLFTWLYNNTGGSGPLAILLHTFFNASLLPVLFPGFDDSLTYELVQDIAFAILACALLLATRGRLSHQSPLTGKAGRHTIGAQQ